MFTVHYPYFLSLNKFLMCFNYTSSLLSNKELTFSSRMNMQTAIVTKQYIYYIAYDNVQTRYISYIYLIVKLLLVNECKRDRSSLARMKWTNREMRFSIRKFCEYYNYKF